MKALLDHNVKKSCHQMYHNSGSSNGSQHMFASISAMGQRPSDSYHIIAQCKTARSPSLRVRRQPEEKGESWRKVKRLSVRAVALFASCYQCHDDWATQQCLCTAVISVQGWLRKPVRGFVHIVSVLTNLQACDHSAGTVRGWAGSLSCVVSRHMYGDGCRSLQWADCLTLITASGRSESVKTAPLEIDVQGYRFVVVRALRGTCVKPGIAASLRTVEHHC